MDGSTENSFPELLPKGIRNNSKNREPPATMDLRGKKKFSLLRSESKIHNFSCRKSQEIYAYKQEKKNPARIRAHLITGFSFLVKSLFSIDDY